MEYALDWKLLLCTERQQKKSNSSQNDYRSDYENDYDRVVFSTPFRRLQDKAQVFPLERNDFVRTRLTHSVEVAAIARSIGVSVYNELLKKGVVSDNSIISQIPVVLETAGLSHDIGNPPFGHYGEEAIRNTFSEIFNDSKVKLEDKQKKDFLNFDGNCQMFRILTHLQCIKDPRGLHLTYATLATLLKYPFNSIDGNRKDDSDRLGVYYKKFGFFSEEEELAKDVLTKTGLLEGDVAYRHPLAFILEAADDIAYSAADLEDGFKKKILTFERIKEFFPSNECDDDCTENARRKIIDIIGDSDHYYSDEKKLQDIRIVLQSIMIKETVDAFVNHYPDIMNKTFKQELLMVSHASGIRTRLKELSNKYIISNPDIQTIELGGEEVIRYLISRFMKSLGNEDYLNFLLNGDKKQVTGNQERLYNMISEDYRKVFRNRVNEIKNDIISTEQKKNKVYYEICLLVVDYISGMTDSYCTELYKKLKGLN